MICRVTQLTPYTTTLPTWSGLGMVCATGKVCASPRGRIGLALGLPSGYEPRVKGGLFLVSQGIELDAKHIAKQSCAAGAALGGGEGVAASVGPTLPRYIPPLTKFSHCPRL
jgi:hypothetical protein